MSPAKLALRRHLSQEKLTATHHGLPTDDRCSLNLVGVGELISSEIERTLNEKTSPPPPPPREPPRDMYSPISRPGSAETLEGLAYPPQGLQALAHAAFTSAPTRRSVVQPRRYTPVALPRAEMKPYHESFFADVKPSTFAPVEGLAASLSARAFHGSEVGLFTISELLLFNFAEIKKLLGIKRA